MGMGESIPTNASLVFKGKIFDVYQWEQTMFDGSVKTFEILKRPNTVQTLAVVGDKILVQLQEQPGKGRFISLPGGRLEGGEDVLAGAKRELKEETGYESDDWVKWIELEPVPKIVFKVSIFIARNCKQVAEKTLEAGEKIENKLVSFDELLELSDRSEEFRQRDLAMFLLEMRLHLEKKEQFKALLWPGVDTAST